jgi:hypothetical protein
VVPLLSLPRRPHSSLRSAPFLLPLVGAQQQHLPPLPCSCRGQARPLPGARHGRVPLQWTPRRKLVPLSELNSAGRPCFPLPAVDNTLSLHAIRGRPLQQRFPAVPRCACSAGAQQNASERLGAVDSSAHDAIDPR